MNQITRPCETCGGAGYGYPSTAHSIAALDERACPDCDGTGTRQVACAWCEDEATRLDPAGDPVCAAHLAAFLKVLAMLT
jgi:DnaJ-class molecular chaperone